MLYTKYVPSAALCRFPLLSDLPCPFFFFLRLVLPQFMVPLRVSPGLVSFPESQIWAYVVYVGDP